MKTLRYTFYEDEGHGWLQVPREAVAKFGVTPSSYSYMDAKYFYLEEDSEAPAFVKAAEARGFTVVRSKKYCSRLDIDHPVRSLDRVL